jgi:prephenate dehydrogenase
LTQLPVIQPGRVAASGGQPPIFQKIGIVGLGLIGGSIALAARQIWPAALVIGVDNKDVLETAMRLHAIDVAADDPIVLAEVDLVILAAPVRTNIELLGELDDHVHQPAVVTDTGSTKRAVVDAARALPAKFTFIGGHPLGGGARGGLENARPDLFKGRPWLLTPTGEKGDAFDKLSASALMQVVGEAVGQDGLALAGRGLADTTRLASSPPEIWRDIAATNADEIGPALDVLIALLQDLRRDLPAGERLFDVFSGAANWRRALSV